MNKIEVRKVDFGIITATAVNCIDFEYWANSDMKVYIFESPKSIDLFMDIIGNLQQDTVKYDFDHSPDVRAKLLVYHQNNKIDILCMDNGGCIMLNDRLYIFDERLLILVEKL